MTQPLSPPEVPTGHHSAQSGKGRLRLAAVIPWRDLGRWIWAHLPEEDYRADLIFAAPEPDARSARQRLLPPYLAELVHLLRRRPRWDEYDVIFTWELRATLATALLRRLMGQRQARFVALAPIIKNRMRRVVPLFRPLLADADRIVCFSTHECDLYAQMLRLPRERFVFLPLAWQEDETESDEDGGFILALGHSNRDYNLLVEAARGTDLPVTIVSLSPDWLTTEPPPNVTLKYNTGFHESRALIARATLHAIPLKPEGYSSGQTVMLQAMARGKAVVVSDVPGVRDYVRAGETAVLVPPGDAAALRAQLQRLWDDAAERRRLGRSAARAVREEFGFSRFARALAQMAEELTGRTAEANTVR